MGTQATVQATAVKTDEDAAGRRRPVGLGRQSAHSLLPGSLRRASTFLRTAIVTQRSVVALPAAAAASQLSAMSCYPAVLWVWSAGVAQASLQRFEPLLAARRRTLNYICASYRCTRSRPKSIPGKPSPSVDATLANHIANRPRILRATAAPRHRRVASPLLSEHALKSVGTLVRPIIDNKK